MRLERFLARLLIFEGKDQTATAILARIVPHMIYPGFWEIAQAKAATGNAACSMMRPSKKHSLLYFPAPKCASTSMRNMFNLIDGVGKAGEEVHDLPDHYQMVAQTDLKTAYANYKKILIVRDPLERLRSYFFGNIQERNHLLVDTGGKKTFYGLSTKPDYDEFLERLPEYRRAFITVRYHSEAITSYVGTEARLFDKIASLGTMEALRCYLAEMTGMAVPQVHDMQTADHPETSKLSVQREQALAADFYAADYATFGAYF